MIQTARSLLPAIAIALAVSASGLAQETAPTPRSATPASDSEGFLQSLPKVRELPASLLAPAPPSAPKYNPLDEPYFVPDPLLDPPGLPPPGWFAALELDVLKPHIKNQLIGPAQNAVQAGAGTSTTVALGSAPLDWAVSPKVFLGYRLPAGFGDVALTYRGLGTQGGESIVTEDGPATLHSRLDFNIIDLDYVSREISLWPNWDMKWTVGVRTLFVFFDSRSEQPFAQAAAGSGIFEMRETNRFVGVGPHAGLELARYFADTGLSLVFRTDFSSDWARIHEGFFTRSTTLGPDGQPLAGETHNSYEGNPLILTGQVGMSWQPPAYPAARLFVGYQYEYWWRLAGNGNPGATASRADMWDQGVVLQAALRF